MKTATIYRKPCEDSGIFGVLAVPDLSWSCYSLERRWVNNAPFVSCIPVGEYVAQCTDSAKFKRKTYQVVHVPHRTGIRIHPANFVHELHGCISFGTGIGWIGNKKGLLNSKLAVDTFEMLMERKPFKLVIV